MIFSYFVKSHRKPNEPEELEKELKIFGYWLSNHLLGFAVVHLVCLFYGVQDLFGHTSQVEGSVRSIGASGPSTPAITTTVPGVLAQEWVAHGGQGEEDNDGSESKEKSSAKVEGESSVGVAVGVVAGVGVVVVLLGVPTASGLVRKRGLDLSVRSHCGEEEEGDGES